MIHVLGYQNTAVNLASGPNAMLLHLPALLTAPALDCHTGEAPATDSPVPVDHWVLFGTDEAPDGWGTPVTLQPTP